MLYYGLGIYGTLNHVIIEPKSNSVTGLARDILNILYLYQHHQSHTLTIKINDKLHKFYRIKISNASK